MDDSTPINDEKKNAIGAVGSSMFNSPGAPSNGLHPLSPSFSPVGEQHMEREESVGDQRGRRGSAFESHVEAGAVRPGEAGKPWRVAAWLNATSQVSSTAAPVQIDGGGELLGKP